MRVNPVTIVGCTTLLGLAALVSFMGSRPSAQHAPTPLKDTGAVGSPAEHSHELGRSTQPEFADEVALANPALEPTQAGTAAPIAADEDAAPSPPSRRHLNAQLERWVALGYSTNDAMHDDGVSDPPPSPADGDLDVAASAAELRGLLRDREAAGARSSAEGRALWRVHDMAEVQLSPVYRDGQLLGLKIRGLPPDRNNAFVRAGLQVSDTITSVNDVDASSTGADRWGLMRELANAEIAAIKVRDTNGHMRDYVIE